MTRTHTSLIAPFRLLFAGVFTLFLLAACSKSSRQYKMSGKAILPDSVSFGHTSAAYAEGFRISYHKTYKMLEILNPYQDKTDTLRYILKPKGVQLPKRLEKARVIDIPVQSMIATSTTHVALTDMLEANNVIIGMAGAGYVYNPEIRRRVRQKDIVSFPQGEINKEKALALGPDLIMISAGQSSQLDDYKVLMESGINILVNSEWLETTPLGKAEWVKVMAALLNKEKLANERFGEIARRYNKLKDKVEKVDQKPLVFNNLPYKGAWFVSGGNSFTAQYLKDAGADYPWFENSSTGGLRKDFEAVYEVGLRADIWLNPGAASTREQILEKDARFKDFKVFETGRIYNNNKRMSPSGGNDFWESGVARPDRLLADLIRIFHPAILPGHELFYYQKVGPS